MSPAACLILLLYALQTTNPSANLRRFFRQILCPVEIDYPAEILQKKQILRPAAKIARPPERRNCMGPGFLGTRASLMLDVVVCSLLLVGPVLVFSVYWVRVRRLYDLHKKVQIAVTIVLAIVVVAFEVDMQMQGGFWELARGSAYYESAFLRQLLYVHLIFSISTAILWPLTAVTAWYYFPSPARPNFFSRTHKVMAWITVGDMIATIVTGLMVYYFGFIA